MNKLNDVEVIGYDHVYGVVELAGPSTTTPPTIGPFEDANGKIIAAMASGSTYLCTDTKEVKFYTRSTKTWD